MSKFKPLISQIVTFHAEGVLAHYTLSGLLRVRDYAQIKKVPLEFVLMLDKADALTTRIVKNHPLISQSDQVIEVNHGDPSLSRNTAVQAASGEYIGTIDGDDYCSANWPVAALNKAKNAKDAVVVHPALCVSFETGHCIEHILDMDRDYFSSAACLTHNPWVSCSFGSKEIYIAHPYCCANVRETGFGYEDWHWNVELLAYGIKHVCASETAHFYRRKAQSRLVSDVSMGAIIRPSTFFDQVDRWGGLNAGAAI